MNYNSLNKYIKLIAEKKEEEEKMKIPKKELPPEAITGFLYEKIPDFEPFTVRIGEQGKGYVAYNNKGKRVAVEKNIEQLVRKSILKGYLYTTKTPYLTEPFYYIHLVDLIQ